MSHNQRVERIKSLEDEIAKMQRELKQERAQEKQEIEKQNRRRKLIGGDIIETHALKNQQSEFAKTYIGLLKESVSPIDRWLFSDIFRALLPPNEADALLAKSPNKPKTSDKTKAAE
jgi:hypothetical protein